MSDVLVYLSYSVLNEKLVLLTHYWPGVQIRQCLSQFLSCKKCFSPNLTETKSLSHQVVVGVAVLVKQSKIV